MLASGIAQSGQNLALSRLAIEAIGGTVFCPLARHIILCLVLVQPRLRSDMAERNVDMEVEHQHKQHKQTKRCFNT